MFVHDIGKETCVVSTDFILLGIFLDRRLALRERLPPSDRQILLKTTTLDTDQRLFDHILATTTGQSP